MKQIAAVLAMIGVLTLPACHANSAVPDTHAYPSRVSSGEISLRLTPHLAEDGTLIVDVHSDTHSGDLSELNFARAMALHVDGNTYAPIATKPMAGHHADGSATFKPGNLPQSFAITLSGVRGASELRFQWP